jgi:long-chain acyl-CoA synthetase
MGFYTMAAEYACYSPADRSLAATPMYTGAGLSFALAPLFFGGTSEILPRFEADTVLRHLRDGGITSTFLVPTQFEALFQTGQEIRAPALKAIISGAAPLGDATKAQILDRFGDGVFHELHGSNETGYVTNLRPEDQRRKRHCVGLPYAAVELRLLDENGRDVPRGEVGEIFARSPMLFNGYWQRPEATAEAFRDGFASVGDMGRQDEEGYLYLVDRKKEMIKTGGSAVYPREVEEVLARHPAVQEVAVFGIADAYWGEAVTAAVILRPARPATTRRCAPIARRVSRATRFPRPSTWCATCRATPAAR